MDERTDTFKLLAVSTLGPDTGYARPFFYTQNPVTAFSAALEVMTDLRFIPAVTIPADIDVDTATQKMIARGVRSLLVVDSDDIVVGILTPRHLLDGRTEAVMRERGIPFNGIKARDIMTASDCIEVLQLQDVLHARVGDIVETMKDSCRQHALVVDQETFSGKDTIRGIFSASQIARQLGVRAPAPEISETFAEIDRALRARLLC